MTEQLFQQQLESPSGTGVSNPEFRSALQTATTRKADTGKPSGHSHWQIRRACQPQPECLSESLTSASRCPKKK